MKTYLIAATLTLVGLAACAPNTDVSTSSVVATQDYTAKSWAAKTLPELSVALQNGDVSSEDLVKAYLERIEKIDRSGPGLQSVLALNPNALADARKHGGKATLKTVQGEPLTVALHDGKLWVIDAEGGKAGISVADVSQSNGVIHVVDTVLMPK